VVLEDDMAASEILSPESVRCRGRAAKGCGGTVREVGGEVGLVWAGLGVGIVDEGGVMREIWFEESVDEDWI
jgi:hypothetical protein